ERKQAEEEKIRLLEKKQELYKALEINRGKFKDAQLIAGIGSWEWDLQSQTGKLSKEAYESIGFDSSGTAPDLQKFIKMLDPEHRSIFLHAWQAATDKGERFDITLKLQIPRRPARWIRAIGQPILDESGNIVKVAGVHYDLTEQKQTEERIAELLRLSQEMNTRLLASEEELKQALNNTLALNKKIRESEQRWQFALEGSGSGVWDWDLVTNEIFIDDTLKELLGFKHSNIADNLSQWESKLFPEDKDRVIKDLNTMTLGKSERYQLEYRMFRSHEADIRWVLVRGKVVERNSEGKPLRMTGTMMDTTEQKQYQAWLANAANYLDKIINTILDPIFVKDREHRLVLVNDACCALFQMNREALLGKNDYELVPNENAEIFQQGDDYVFATGKDMVSEEEFTQPDGRVRIIITKKSLYVDADDQSFVVGTVVDITDRKELEQRLQEQNENLVKINAELDSFVYRTSHDLRSPLASVLGLIGVSRLEQNEQERLLYLELMEKSIRKLDSFIHDIINYAKNARVAVVHEEVDLQLLVQEILEGLKFMEGFDSIDKKIEIVQTIPFYSDPFRLKIIFNNLLSNAIKYRASRADQSYILVQMQIDRQRADLRIIDNGKGIAPENLSKIFDMFFRASTSSTGSGIGLYIVKEAVNTLGGNITVASVLGQGTTFTVALPNAAPETSSAL
ncbi:MAG: PAS domain S-box protein, partial [Bacteroidetes bacterium]|nr:PAS domain S-box protein [Bacteroidota bacterium]